MFSFRVISDDAIHLKKYTLACWVNDCHSFPNLCLSGESHLSPFPAVTSFTFTHPHTITSGS